MRLLGSSVKELSRWIGSSSLQQFSRFPSGVAFRHLLHDRFRLKYVFICQRPDDARVEPRSPPMGIGIAMASDASPGHVSELLACREHCLPQEHKCLGPGTDRLNLRDEFEHGQQGSVRGLRALSFNEGSDWPGRYSYDPIRLASLPGAPEGFLCKLLDKLLGSMPSYAGESLGPEPLIGNASSELQSALWISGRRPAGQVAIVRIAHRDIVCCLPNGSRISCSDSSACALSDVPYN